MADFNTQDIVNSAQSQVYANNAFNSAQAQKQMDYQSSSNAKAMAFSAEQAKANRDWQENMSNTAHQREVQDLIKAGLNPVLSVNNGASVGSGSSAQGVASGGSKADADTGMSNVLSGLLQAVIGQATALQTTSMNNMTALDSTKMNNDNSLLTTRMLNDTALKTSQIGAGAMLNTANINSYTQQLIQQKQQAFEEFIKKNYPQNTIGGISSLWQNAKDAFNSAGGNSASSHKNLVDKLGGNSSKPLASYDNLGELGKFLSWLKGK